MKFKELRGNAAEKNETLSQEYKAAHSYGVAAVGTEHLFVKKGFSVYYIAYRDAERIFRRIRSVNAMMCCENGEMEFEYLVVADAEKELIEIQLPGKKAAQMMMEELKSTVPEGNFAAP